ncbi:aminopeptidase P family protein [Demequina globuliformis]|uniref:aminopeptidase P family protein n=1 Tax=Demequina globuliformis TaxID=676202 RepID=UPI000784C9E8|nr:aminopeptidase P family protein [Demequina globuliformis]
MSDDKTSTTSDKSNKARALRPDNDEFKTWIGSQWAEPDDLATQKLGSAPYAAQRRARLSARFPGKRIVAPAGDLKVRSNDTDYRFSPSRDFAYLTGLGTDREPGAVLVMEPTPSGHDATLYLVPPATKDEDGFYTDPRSGEFWIGRRPGLAEFEAMTGIATAPLSDLPTDIRVANHPHKAVSRVLSEMRLVKDAWEVQQLRDAVDATIAGFERVVGELPRAIEHKRGERVVEATFDGHAREEGNAVGYETIAASGPHATTLHWITNDGQVHAGDLLLLDAGVEVDSLYTADITRTMPVTGQFSPVQRRVYDVVLEAADAAFAVAAPGVTLRDVHEAAMDVIEARLTEWGIVPEAKSDDSKLFRRWMVHSTSHHLGLDVHDCAAAKRETYMDGPLEPGMVFTIEPGLYFKADDLAVPEELRGIGVRIEDDVLVTDDGVENLSQALPRTADAVEAWMNKHRTP